jgi:peptidoglycan/xylan/chitin deacetylase (PgdA/CDA1 family)
LPDRALLITFDDGWADNEEYALPLLKAAGLPAVVFAVAAGIGTVELWHEAVRREFRSGRMTADHARRLWAEAADRQVATCPEMKEAGDIEKLIDLLAGVANARRDHLLRDIGEPIAPHMMSVAQLNRIYEAGIAIGSHGFTHVPIPKADDIWRELRSSRETLAALLAEPLSSAPTTLSFPHGVYDSACVRAAVEAGYEILFTSEAHLNETDGCCRGGCVLGRVSIVPQTITDESGFRPELLALWLFIRPRAWLHS